MKICNNQKLNSARVSRACYVLIYKKKQC